MALKEQMDALLGGAASRGDVPGVVAMLTDRKGSLYEGAFGVRSLGEPAPMTLDTVGLIASMTKALTAVAVMQLVERKKLDLDAPASRWQPELGKTEVITGFDANDRPQTRPPKTPITLRHLLTHTSGFGYEFINPEVAQYQKTQQLPSLLACEPATLRQPILFDPGERWNYGIGLDWAGQVVEAVAGCKLGDYLAEQVFGPLGMQDTAFVMSPSMRQRLARIHARLPDGSLAPTPVELPQPPNLQLGGAGLYGTVGDYLKFLRMILNEGKTPDGRALLQPETLREMQRNQLGAMDVPSVISIDRTLTNDLILPPEIPHKWSLAWLINTKPLPTGRPAGSLMWAGLTNCYYWIDPQTGIAGVMLSQILPFADEKAMPLFYAFEHTAYANR